jgi:hypothetical protein
LYLYLRSFSGVELRVDCRPKAETFEKRSFQGHLDRADELLVNRSVLRSGFTF